MPQCILRLWCVDIVPKRLRCDARRVDGGGVVQTRAEIGVLDGGVGGGALNLTGVQMPADATLFLARSRNAAGIMRVEDSTTFQLYDITAPDVSAAARGGRCLYGFGPNPKHILVPIWNVDVETLLCLSRKKK